MGIKLTSLDCDVRPFHNEGVVSGLEQGFAVAYAMIYDDVRKQYGQQAGGIFGGPALRKTSKGPSSLRRTRFILFFRFHHFPVRVLLFILIPFNIVG